MTTHHLDQIEGLFKRFGRRTDNYEMISDYQKIADKYDQDLFSMAIKNLRNSSKTLPTPMEVDQEASRIKKYFASQRAKNIDDFDLKCRYFSAQEGAASRSLCRRLEESRIDWCKSRYGKSICDWHEQVMAAETNPFGREASYVKHMLSEALELNEIGQECFLIKRIGFCPWGEDAPETHAEKMKLILARIDGQ